MHLKSSLDIEVLDLGKVSYHEVWNLQKQMQAQRIENQIKDTLILVEHFPVYTLGKNASKKNIIIKSNNAIPIIETDRGGEVTYHGPGQLVGYPILDLKNYKQSITWYMRSLEKIILKVLHKYAIIGSTKKGLTGVWVEDQKISAFGVRISKWVTMHGFSLNLNTDLSHYNGIIPCGLTNYGVTSIFNILNKEVTMQNLKKIIIEEFSLFFKKERV
tara:strand:- start:76 stop:723 length:648 start_codon:yes stop_codon:yes gene_type:complete